MKVMTSAEYERWKARMDRKHDLMAAAFMGFHLGVFVCWLLR